MWVPHQKKKQKNKNKMKAKGRRARRPERFFLIFFSFYFSNLISQIYENLTVGFHRDKHGKCSTGRGLRVSTKNPGFHREFR